MLFRSGINLESVATNGQKAIEVLTLGLSLLKNELGGSNEKSNQQTATPTGPQNSGIPAGSNNSTPPPPPTPTPVPANNATSQVREIKHTIELTVKAETNSPEVNTAVLKALNNDDTVRVLKDNIAKVASDYGLTAT